MSVRNKLLELFRFRKTSLSLLAVLTYAIVIFLDFYADYSSLQPPSPEPLYLSSAWWDLQNILKKPHPFTSHENDRVRQYLAKRAAHYAQSPGVEVWAEKGLPYLFKQKDVFNALLTDVRVIYYELSNVYVKLRGQDPKKLAVLVSAHFDTVETATGPTDDGMGIALMLGMLEYMVTSKYKPERDIIFNFNNDEEFGLLGATAFFNHPWSKNVEHFVNLEGTGAGGRAILFRASDYEAALYYKNVPRPFASLLFQEGFSRRVIASETDYKVYVQNGLKGVDIAFYKPRSLYHTYRDHIATASKGSLYHMMSSAIAVVESMASDVPEPRDSIPEAVFFDVFGRYFVVFPLDKVYIFNIIVLVVFPIIALGLLSIALLRGWSLGLSVFTLPTGLVLGGAAANWIADYIKYKNNMVASLNYNIILGVVFSTFVLVNYLVLLFVGGIHKVRDTKLVYVLELAFFFWAWNVRLTMREAGQSNVTGEWLSTVLVLVFGTASVLGLVGVIGGLRSETKKAPYIIIEDASSSVSSEEQESGDNEENINEVTEENQEDDAEESDETTPLLRTEPQPRSNTYDWSLQFILIVPVSLYFTYLNAHELLQACYNNTHYSNAEVDQFYFFVKMLALGLAIPLIPFVTKINYLVRIALMAVVVIGTLVGSSVFPFTYDNPLKISFYQNIEMAKPGAVEMLVLGREGYTRMALEDLPSVKAGNPVSCTPRSPGMEICSYNSTGPHLVDYQNTLDYSDMLEFKVVRNTHVAGTNLPYEPYEAELYIRAKENRNCYVTFNSLNYVLNKYGKLPVRAVTIFHSKNSTVSYAKLPQGYLRDEYGNDHFKMRGVDLLTLHKLNWEDEYHIGIQWLDQEREGEDGGLSVTVGCYYGEYDESRKTKTGVERILPAYDEMMEYSPEWVIYTKWLPGLVRIGGVLDL